MPNKGIPRPHWNEADDEVIDKFYPDVEKCIEEFEAMGRPRNYDAIVRRAQLIGIAEKDSNTPWNKEETAILVEEYPGSGPSGVRKRLAELGYDRSDSAITSKAKHMNVKRRDRGIVDKWSDHEMTVVRKMFPTSSSADVREALLSLGYDRTEAAINARAQILGVKRVPVRRAGKVGEQKVVNFVLDTVVDRKILAHLKTKRNRSRYIRGLIEQDMAR